MGGRVCGQNICHHVAAFRDSLLNDKQHDCVLKKLNFDPLTPSSGSGGKIFATMLLQSCFSFIWYAKWPFSEKLNFDPLTPSPGPGWGWGALHAKYWLQCCCILWFPFSDMQHNRVLKKLNFDPLTPSPGSWGGGGGLRTKYLNICYHVAAFVILFDHVLKKLNFDPLTPSLCCCISWFPLIWYATLPCSEKVKFSPTDPRIWGRVCREKISYHVAAFLII